MSSGVGKSSEIKNKLAGWYEWQVRSEEVETGWSIGRAEGEAGGFVVVCFCTDEREDDKEDTTARASSPPGGGTAPHLGTHMLGMP